MSAEASLLVFARWRALLLGEWRLAARITIACLGAYGVAEIAGLPQSFWAVLTALLVTQSSVGGSIKAMSDRFIGTLLGGIWGVVVSLLVPHSSPAGMAVALLLSVGPLSFVAALGPAYRVTPVTAIILLLGTGGTGGSPWISAIDRVLEIGLGCVVAMAVSLIILPGRAHRLLATAARDYLEPIATQLGLLVEGLAGNAHDREIQVLHQRIRAMLAKVEAVAVEASRERRSHLTGAAEPEPLVRTLRRLRHDLALVARSTSGSLPQSVAPRISLPITAVADAMAAFMRAAGTAFIAGAAVPSLQPVRSALAVYETEMAAMRIDGTLRAIPDEAVGRLFALAFVLEELAGDLEDLGQRIAEHRG